MKAGKFDLVLIPFRNHLTHTGFDFQHESDTKHTMEHCQAWIGLPTAQTTMILDKCGIILIERTE